MKTGKVVIVISKKLTTDGIYFLGRSSQDVTGSLYYVRFANKQILLDCGLYQSSQNDYLDSYKANSEKFKFSPSRVDYVFISHPHIDHIGLLPRLVAQGFNGKIVITEQAAVIAKDLLFNSCAIVNNEARLISNRFKRNYEPLYTESDVGNTLDLFYTVKDFGEKVYLDDTVSFVYYPNSHCVGAAQIQITLKDERKTRKIFFTGDIGSIKTKNHYVCQTERISDFSDVVLMESTYGEGKRDSRRSRKKDKEILKSAIETTISRGGTVILPTFSFARTQEIATNIYELFGNEKNFNIPVVIDSELSCEICNDYKKVLGGSDNELWQAVMNWENLKMIRNKSESVLCVMNKKPKIIISSSGFCTNGRVVAYLSAYLKDKNSTVIFSGYTGSNPSYLSYRIKNGRNNEPIKINKMQISNRADCIGLTTFSSHASHDDLVEYGSDFNTNKLVLVHGSPEAKSVLKSDLESAISKKDKTFKVVSSTIGMFIRL